MKFYYSLTFNQTISNKFKLGTFLHVPAYARLNGVGSLYIPLVSRNRKISLHRNNDAHPN